MTQKELLYLEDAIKHECSIMTILKDAINKLEDEKLISFIEEQVKLHTKTKGKLLSVLEKKCSE